MAEFYKFEIANWNEGTANMTLEQEAAYLRVVNAIRLSDQPITLNSFALCGMWRCNDRKAKRLLQELVDAGKVHIEDGKIVNDKAVNDASNLRRLRADRASAGHRGGIESGKTRAKRLNGKDTGEAIASTRIEEKREDIEADASIERVSRGNEISGVLEAWASPKAVASFLAYRRRLKSKGLTLTGAKRLAGHLRAVFDGGGDTDDALAMAEERGWMTVEPNWYFRERGKGNGSGHNAGSSHRGGSGGATDKLVAAFAHVAHRQPQ